jgi:N utilization substance protein B
MARDETAAGVGGRHEARERALALLYEADQKGVSVVEVLAALPLPADPFTERLVRGVDQHSTALDDLLTRKATNWRLDRMALLDRAILRLGAFELLHEPDVPAAVAIDEAVELAKAYCGDDSPRFVNGVLAAIAGELPAG